MSDADETYKRKLRKLIELGVPRPDRTGTGTISLFGEQMRFNLAEEFPLITSKKVHFHSVMHEVLWFLMGSDPDTGDATIHYLHENDVTIWDEWADKSGRLGPVYGVQWREWIDPSGAEPIDQIQAVIDGLRNDPYSRRHIVSAWSVAELRDMALEPCHVMFQFYVTPSTDGGPDTLSCHLYQRSGDMFLGVPFNIASYALLTHMIANVVQMKVGELIISFGDLHLYDNHYHQAMELLRRPEHYGPFLRLSEVENIDDYGPEHIRLENYEHEAAIKAPVAI